VRRTLAVVATVVVNAAAQAAIVGIAPRDPFSAGAILLAALSLLALVVAAAIIAGRTVAWTVIGAILVVAAAVVLPYAVPVVVAVAAAVAVSGSPGAALAVARRHPIRTALLLLVTVLFVLLGWVSALLFGLLFGGVPGSAATWLVAGALAVVVVALWARSALADPSGAPVRGA
jgi:hypothetical protein